jgi:hypothetical protein
MNENKINKALMGVYYLPTNTILGCSVLSSQKIIDKKYIKNNEKIYGYYSGLKLLNELRVTQQVPSNYEVISSNSKSQTQNTKIYSFDVKVRRSNVQVNRENVNTLILLEVFRVIRRPLSEYESRGLRDFVSENDIKRKDIFEYSKYFSPKVIANMISTGIDNIFAQ